MAAFDTPRSVFGSTPVANRFFAAIAAPVSAMLAWNDARVTRNALSSLSDRELEDIGLIRGDIDAVADSRY